MTGERIITLENVCAGSLIIWGAFVANPYVDTFLKNPALYAGMSQLYNNEIFWGTFYILAGIIALITSFKIHPKYGALVVGIAYTSLCTLYFRGDFESQGWGVFGFFGFCSLIKSWRYGWKFLKVSNG